MAAAPFPPRRPAEPPLVEAHVPESLRDLAWGVLGGIAAGTATIALCLVAGRWL